MFEETAEDLGPTSDIRYILADQFGPEMSGKCALTWVGRCLEGEHFCSLREGLSQDGLNVIGKAKNVCFHEMGIQGVVCGTPPGMLGEGG